MNSNEMVYACFGKQGIRLASWFEYFQANAVDPNTACICEWEFLSPQTTLADGPRIWSCPLIGCRNVLVPFIPVQT